MNNLKAEIEREIEKFLRLVPFHTLFFLYDIEVKPSSLGGTCSDRSLYFLDILKLKFGPKLNAGLHRCSIQGKETHTVIRITIDDLDYIVDVGMGFPIMKLIPCYQAISFQAFGISFWTNVENHQIRLYSNMSGKAQEIFALDPKPQDNETVMAAIEKRYKEKAAYPFDAGIRYFVITEDKYIQIKHDNILNSKDKPVVHVFEDKNYS